MTNPNEMAAHTIASVKGWCGAGGAALAPIAEIIMRSSPGDHIEIGSLFGASAIIAAKSMEEANRPKTYNVYCIDPMLYEEHEACCTKQGTETEKMMLQHQRMIFRDNTAKYPRIKLIRARSQPWPLDPNKHFVTAFLDGWHYDDTPLQDVRVLAEIVDEYIMVDDMQKSYPSVMRAIVYLMEHPDWEFLYKANRTAVFVRIPDIYRVEYTTEGKVPLVVECEI